MPWPRGLVLNILPQTHDKVINRPRISIFTQSPNILEYQASRHNLSFVIDQVTQQLRFHQREMYDCLLTRSQLERLEVDRLPLKLKNLRRTILHAAVTVFVEPLATTQQRINPRQQHRQIERLRKIIVRARFKPAQYILRLPTRSQHQDGNELPLRPQSRRE